MAKPITENEVEIVDEGLKLNIILPNKIFSTGKKGFFKQGMFKNIDGKYFRLNLQAYEVDKK